MGHDAIIPGCLACGERHDRLEAVEALSSRTATQVVGLMHDMDTLRPRVDGLAHAHEATLVAVRASTEASGQLRETLNQLRETLNPVVIRVDNLANDYRRHEIQAEKDKRSLPQLAIWLWTASLSAGVFFFLWVLSNWQHLLDLIK